MKSEGVNTQIEELKLWRRGLYGDIKGANGLYVCRAKSGSIADLIVEAVNSFILKPDAALAQKDEDLWLEFVGKNHCGLCGNSGVIDTRGKIKTAAGFECGVRQFCICPNGRAWKANGADLNKLDIRLALPSTPPAIFDRDEVIEEVLKIISERKNCYAAKYANENPPPDEQLKLSFVVEVLGMIKNSVRKLRDKSSPLHKDKA